MNLKLVCICTGKWNFTVHYRGYCQAFDVVMFIVATHSPTLISEAAKSDQTGVEGNVMVLSVAQHQATDAPASSCAIYSFAQIASHEQLILNTSKQPLTVLMP